MSDDSQPPRAVMFSPSIVPILAGYVLGFLFGLLVMLCLTLLGVV